MTTPHDWADVLERAADECMDAREWDEYTRQPRGGNVILESDAAALRTLAAAMRSAKPDDIADVKITGRYRLTLPESP